jgi:hypothetical protein
MEDQYPQGQSCLQKKRKLLRHVSKTSITFFPPVIGVPLEIQEPLMLPPMLRQEAATVRVNSSPEVRPYHNSKGGIHH